MKIEKVWLLTKGFAPETFPNDLKNNIKKSEKVVGYTDWLFDYDGFLQVELKGGYVVSVLPERIKRLKKNQDKKIPKSKIPIKEDYYKIKKMFNF